MVGVLRPSIPLPACLMDTHAGVATESSPSHCTACTPDKDTLCLPAESSPNSEQQKQPPQVAPETAPSSANVPNPLKNLPVLTDPAAPISQSAQETLSEKGGAAAETVKKAADQAPGLFDLLKGGLLHCLLPCVVLPAVQVSNSPPHACICQAS